MIILGGLTLAFLLIILYLGIRLGNASSKVVLNILWITPLLLYLLWVADYSRENQITENVKTITYIERVGHLSKPLKIKVTQRWTSRWNISPTVETVILKEEN